MAAKMSQSEILAKLGIKVTPQFKNQISGNGRLQQFINQQAALKGLPEPFNPSLASTIIQDVLPLAVIAATIPATTASGASTATGTGATGATTSTALKAAGAGLTGALSISDSWQQLLVRALEALVGIALLLLGLQALTGTGAQGNPIRAARAVRSAL